jgi:hypothetical protein
MIKKTKIDKSKETKAKASSNARIVQAEVKIRLQEWIKSGIVEEELKNIIISSAAKDGDKLRAIEVLTKLAGFETEPAKVAQTDAEGNDIVAKADFEELKALWMLELQQGKETTLEENCSFLENATDEDIEKLINEGIVE